MTDSTSSGGPQGADEASAEATPDTAEVASTQVSEHDQHQGLVEDARVDTEASEADLWQRTWDDAGGGELTDHDRPGDAGIEPTVIAPSALRGHSHDTGPQEPLDDTHEGSSLEEPPAESASDEQATDAASSEAAPASAAATASDSSVSDATPADEPPALVEPPRLRLRGSDKPDLDDTAPFEGLCGAGAAAAATAGASSASATDAEAAEPTPTVAMPQAASDPEFEVGDDAVTEAAPTVAEPTPAAERTGTITVDDETARAAATGTPIVLVETPTPPKKKGARGVGFVVVLLATIIFGALLAAGFVAVGFLFDRGFSLDETLQSLWLRPAWLLPVVVFFVAYWLTTIIVNRAGWWAHVLGGFIIAILAYAGHIGGTYLEAQSNEWDVLSLTSLGVDDLAQLVLAPMSVVTFILAREVPIWLGGIVSKRGRKAKERNRTAIEEFERENAERLAEYESTRA